jgi:hypothetical protein
MDYLERPPGLPFLISEIKHPVTAINDFPAPSNQFDRGTIQIE